MSSAVPTSHAVSPDSGEHWAAPGAWEVADGIHRIPLPLPMDGLRAVNVYTIASDDGLVLIDGGWAVSEARGQLDRSLRSIGSGFGDIRRFLVTHLHRDHYTLASVLGHEYGADLALGIDEKPGLDLLHRMRSEWENPIRGALVEAGAFDVAEEWHRVDGELPEASHWQYPSTWLKGDVELMIGARTLDAVHTPGHTPGHYVFADRGAGLLFAGDHVLPTITPSIGFTVPVPEQPLGEFIASLGRVRTLPDLRLLPAHGPVGASSHARVDELLRHHEKRLADALTALGGGTQHAAAVAGHLGWTRHDRQYQELDLFNKGVAATETKAHLELLVARGQVTKSASGDGAVMFAVA